MDYILNVLLWLVKWIFKLLWRGAKMFLGIKSDSPQKSSKNGTSKITKKQEQMGGLFDHRIPTNWTATFWYHAEHIRVTLHNRKTRPAEFEFLNELRKMRGGRINVSEAKLMNIQQG